MKLIYPLPRSCYVACSYGADSMAALHFLSRVPGRVMGVLHVNHGTGEYADKSEELLTQYCKKEGRRLEVYPITTPLPSHGSREQFWRDERYSFFHAFDAPVVLAHNFDDCLEEYVMCTMVRGYSSTIPYRNGNCIRPFRLWKKKDIREYAAHFNIPYLEDPSNTNTKYKRNKIRHDIIPHITQLNPGVWNIVERLIRKESNENL